MWRRFVRFSIVTDTSANLPNTILLPHAVGVAPLTYFIEENAHTCIDIEEFDGAQYYESIRKGVKVTTSQINPQRYLDCFTPLLERGQVFLYV